MNAKIFLKTSTVALLAALIGTQQANAQSTVTKQGVVYTLASGHYEATGFDLSNAQAEQWNDTLRVADTIGEVPVTTVADNAFDFTANRDCAQIKFVVLGNNVTSIGNYAFYQCAAITGVQFNEGLKAIGNNAFFNCTAIAALTLPESLEQVGTAAFLGCTSVATLTVKAGGLNIGTSAFSSCSRLRVLRFLNATPVVGSTAFYGIGRANDPAYLYVPTAYFSDYIALMRGNGDVYGWANGDGYVSLRTEQQGLVYSYVAASGSNTAFLRLQAIDNASLVNKGTEANPAYLVQAADAIASLPVKDIADGAFSTSLNASIFAIDLRRTAVSGFDVDRTTSTFAGVNTQTLIYLPAGNTTDESNVIINGEVATTLQIGRPVRTMTADEVKNGRATWLFNSLRSAHVYGQQIGTDQTPLPMTNSDVQEVWQAAFQHGTTRQNRYANTGGTVTLPAAADLGFEASQVVTFYVSDDISRPFTAASTVSTDLDIYAHPQTASITLSTDTLTFFMSAPATERFADLLVTALPAESRTEVTWSSSDEVAASVSADGRVTGLVGGKAVITATSKDNPAVTATCRVTVVPRVERIELEENSIRVALSDVVDPVYQLKAHIYPTQAVQDVLWESQDTEVATIDENGLVRGISAGSTAIIATPKDRPSIMAVCYVTVLPAANSVWISRNTYTMLPGDQEALRAQVLPSTAIQAIQWSTSDASTVKVSDAGVITAIKPGVATITATSVAMPSLNNKCVVTVVGEGTQTNIRGFVYEVRQLDADVQDMTIVNVTDSLLRRGGEITIPDSVTFARLRFKVAAVADNAISQPQNNTLFFIPSYITYNGQADNVVVGKNGGNTCSRLIITEGEGFETSHSFVADEVEYERTCPTGVPFAFSFPYPLQNKQAGLHFYGLSEQKGDTLVFNEVDEVEPYVPYLAVAEESVVNLGGTSITVRPYTRNTDVYVGNVQFVATMKRLAGGSLMALHGQKLSLNNEWQPITANDTVEPLTAWLSSEQTPLYTKLVEKAVDTAIHNINTIGNNRADAIFDLSGRYMGTQTDALPKGIYVRNGHKFVK